MHLLLLSPTQANELLQSSKQIQNKIDKERTLRESLRLYQQISQHTDLPLVCSQYRQGSNSQDTSTFSAHVFGMFTNAVELFQCVFTRESSSCASQQQTRRIHRDSGPTFTRTESLRRTEWGSRPSRKGTARKTSSTRII